MEPKPASAARLLGRAQASVAFALRAVELAPHSWFGHVELARSPTLHPIRSTRRAPQQNTHLRLPPTTPRHMSRCEVDRVPRRRGYLGSAGRCCCCLVLMYLVGDYLSLNRRSAIVPAGLCASTERPLPCPWLYAALRALGRQRRSSVCSVRSWVGLPIGRDRTTRVVVGATSSAKPVSAPFDAAMVSRQDHPGKGPTEEVPTGRARKRSGATNQRPRLCAAG